MEAELQEVREVEAELQEVREMEAELLEAYWFDNSAYKRVHNSIRYCHGSACV